MKAKVYEGADYLEFFESDTDKLRRELLDPVILQAVAPAGKNILDLGCGEGYLCRMLKSNGAQKTVGADISAGLIEAAQRSDPAGDYRVFDLVKGEVFAKEQFDAVVANLMLMAVPNLNIAFQKVSQFLKPNARFVASIVNPYYGYPVGIWKKNLRHFLSGDMKPSLEITNYFEPPDDTIRLPGTKTDVPHFPRKFSEYIQYAEQVNLKLENLIEPTVSEELKTKYKNTLLSYQLTKVPLFQVLIFKHGHKAS